MGGSRLQTILDESDAFFQSLGLRVIIRDLPKGEKNVRRAIEELICRNDSLLCPRSNLPRTAHIGDNTLDTEMSLIKTLRFAEALISVTVHQSTSSESDQTGAN